MIHVFRPTWRPPSTTSESLQLRAALLALRERTKRIDVEIKIKTFNDFLRLFNTFYLFNASPRRDLTHSMLSTARQALSMCLLAPDVSKGICKASSSKIVGSMPSEMMWS